MSEAKAAKGETQARKARKASSGLARVCARAREVNGKDRRARINFIADVMEELAWERGKTGPALAAIWGLSLKSVEGDAAEASRRVIADPTEARRDITAGARRLYRQCVENGDAKGATAIGGLLAAVSGAKTPEEHVVVSTTTNPAEAARLVREAFGEKAMPSGHKPNGMNGHTKPNGSGTVPPPPAGS